MNTDQEIKLDVSLVIPCYQEEGHFLESVSEIFHVMNATKYSFEIIFVDDQSTDRTKQYILQLEKKHANVRAIFHEKNTGKGASVADGVRIAKGKWIGHLDIDLEVSAEYLPVLLLELKKGADIVLINRKVKFSLYPQNLMRDMAGMIHRLLVRFLLGIPLTDVQSGCKFFKREVFFTLLNKTRSAGWFFDVELIAIAYRSGYAIVQVPGFYIRNKMKKSTVRLFSDGWRQLKDLLKFSKEMKKAGK